MPTLTAMQWRCMHWASRATWRPDFLAESLSVGARQMRGQEQVGVGELLQQRGLVGAREVLQRPQQVGLRESPW